MTEDGVYNLYESNPFRIKHPDSLMKNYLCSICAVLNALYYINIINQSISLIVNLN